MFCLSLLVPVLVCTIFCTISFLKRRLLLKLSLIYLLADWLAVFICFTFFVKKESDLSFGDLFWSLFLLKQSLIYRLALFFGLFLFWSSETGVSSLNCLATFLSLFCTFMYLFVGDFSVPFICPFLDLLYTSVLFVPLYSPFLLANEVL